MKTPGIGTTVQASAVLLASAALALQPSSAMAMEASAAETPEEVIVTGRQTRRQLQVRIELAQDRMFGLFNELNDDDRYDIKCTVDTVTGSLISQRVCRPEFLRKTIELNARAFLAGIQGAVTEDGGTLGSSAAYAPVPQAEINYRYPILREKMSALVEQNSDFAAAVAEHQALLEEMELLESK